MKMMLIIVDSNRSDIVESTLNAPEVKGFSEITGVLGKGVLGAKMGNRAFPGSSTLYFAAVPKSSCAKLLENLKEVTDESAGLKVFSIDTVEEL